MELTLACHLAGVARLFHAKEKSCGALLSRSLSTLASGDIFRIYVELQMAPKRLSLFWQFLWRYSTAAWDAQKRQIGA
jgi:hypothetical protein